MNNRLIQKVTIVIYVQEPQFSLLSYSMYAIWIVNLEIKAHLKSIIDMSCMDIESQFIRLKLRFVLFVLDFSMNCVQQDPSYVDKNVSLCPAYNYSF